MKTRFEQLAVGSMVLFLIALIARNRFVPAPVELETKASTTSSIEKSSPSLDPPRRTSESPSADDEASKLNRFSREIRVSLTNLPVRSCKLRCETSFTIIDHSTGNTLRELPRLASCVATPGEEGLNLGDLSFKEKAIELIPAASPALWVNGSQYRGRIRLFRTGSGRIRIVNVVPLEEYLASVVDSEMPIAFGSEARKAQCIASRTYALYQMRQRAAHPQFDLFASEQSQKYLGTRYRNARGQLWAGESENSCEIVQQTEGLVCTFEDDLFCTYFSASCGGRTNCGTDLFSDAAPPLCGVDCDWCRDAKYYRWTNALSSSDQIRLIDSIHHSTPNFGNSFRVIDAPQSLLQAGPLDRVGFSDGSQLAELTVRELREEVFPHRLLSPMFVVEESGNQIVISGRGHGHGIGMCQWGAKGLAETGRSATEILEYYYPGCNVVRWNAQDFGEPQ